MKTTTLGIRVNYYYSACVGIASPEVRVLCDPWFTEGIYDGSWFQYPKLDNPIETIGEADYIYVSHIHPDHYDPRFLREYLLRFPDARVIIAPFVPNYLSKKMTVDGIEHEVLESLTVGETAIDLILSGVGPPSSIDSALVMRWRDRSVVNFNDNPGGAEQLDAINALCGSIDIALLPYAGAGAWPQTYFEHGDELREMGDAKKERSFDRYRRIAAALDPKVRIPFAGKYVLGGRLSELNNWRGVGDAVEVTEFDSRAVVLADGGQASIETETLTASAIRDRVYGADALDEFGRSIADRKMDYEEEFAELDLAEVPFGALLERAYEHAHGRSTCEVDWQLCIEVQGRWAVFNANRNSPSLEFSEKLGSVLPRSEIRIDNRYLYGLLTGVYHWNNAEIGSQYETRRFPEQYRPEVQAFLNFFHVPRSEAVS